MEKICEELAELLEVDSVQDDEVLTDFECSEMCIRDRNIIKHFWQKI